MDSGAQSPFCEELAAAFDWWREAGVDCEFADAPTQWLAAVPRPDEAPPVDAPAIDAERRLQQVARAPATIDRSALPADLSGFVAWWLTAPELDAGRTTSRVPPRGQRHAELMVLVPEPEREDRETLLCGPQGRLLDAMARAMGCDAGQIYVASALPRHLPGADWQALAAGPLGPALLHHIALVAPKRLIVFGGNILPLFGNDLPQGAAVLRQINLEGQSFPLLAARSLPALLERPRWKSDLWRAWLGWTG